MKTQVILIPIGSAGDVFPFLALGKELQQRKHHVAVMTNPIFKTNVGQAGLEFIDLGSEQELRTAGTDDRLHQSAEAWKLALRWGAIGTMRQTVSYLKDRRKRCQTLLVASPLSFGARLASEAYDIPLATVVLSPFILRSVYDAPTIKPMWLGDWMPQLLKSLQYRIADQFFIDPVVKKDVNALQQELGLPQSERFLHQWCFSRDLCLAAFDEGFAAVQPDWPENLNLTGHYVWDPPSDDTDLKRLDQFAHRKDDPIVVVSAGSAGAPSANYYQRWIDAAGEVGCQLLILERNSDLVPQALSDSVMHFSYLPMSVVLKHVSAVVHAGGIGATLRTLAAGVPQLILPKVNDQFDNADRIIRLNAGFTGDWEMDTAGAKACLKRLLSGEFPMVDNSRAPTIDPVNQASDYLESIFYRHD